MSVNFNKTALILIHLALLTAVAWSASTAAYSQTSTGIVFGPVDPIQLPNGPLNVAPGQILTLLVGGLSPNGQVGSASYLPLPTSLSGISAQLSGCYDSPMAAPLLAVYQTCNFQGTKCPPMVGVTLQIPTGIWYDKASSATNISCVDTLTFSDQFGNRASMNVLPVASVMRVARSCSGATGICGPTITMADGSDLGVVHAGDVIVAYVNGMGPTDPAIPSGQPTPTAPLPRLVWPVVVNYEFYPNAGPLRPNTKTANRPVYDLGGYEAPDFAGPTPGAVGLYQVNFKIPAIPPGTPRCGDTSKTRVLSNLTISLINEVSVDGFSICVE